MGLIQQAHAERNRLKSDEQKSSYALGVDYMKGLSQDDLNLDSRAFVQGLLDVQSGRGSRLSPAESRKALDLFIVKRIKQRKEKAEQDQVAGRSFLLDNLFREGVKELPSGLQYKVLQQGGGRSPVAGDGISVRYRLSDTQGKEILSSATDGTPRKIMLEGLIPGWNEALPLMKEGDKWQLFMPPSLGYGASGSPDGRIKPNQTLVYELELVAIVPAEEARAEMDKPIVTNLVRGMQPDTAK